MTDVLHYKTYSGAVHYSGEDEVFYGKVLGINDLVSFEGASVQQLKEAFQEAVDDYLETCKDVNKVPEKTYADNLQVNLPVELHRQAAMEAREKGMSLNDFVRYAIKRTLDWQDEEDQQKNLQPQ